MELKEFFDKEFDNIVKEIHLNSESIKKAGASQIDVEVKYFKSELGEIKIIIPVKLIAEKPNNDLKQLSGMI